MPKESPQKFDNLKDEVEGEKPLRTASEENQEKQNLEEEQGKSIGLAKEILESAENGVPAFITKKLEKAAKDFGIEINSQTTPTNRVIDELRNRISVFESKSKKEEFDLTTAEGRQKEIDRIMTEEAAKEEAVNLGEKTEKDKNKEVRGAFGKISAEQKELLEKRLTATEKQEEKIEQEIKQEKSWIREKVEKAADWYKKQPLKYKILFSLGCVGVASASASIGGAVGAAVATAAFTGSAFQRILGGMAIFVAVEGFLKKVAEKGGRERTEWEARRHTLEAAVLGALVGSGKFAEEIRNVAGMIMSDAAVNEVKTIVETVKKEFGLLSEQPAPTPPQGMPSASLETPPVSSEVSHEAPPTAEAPPTPEKALEAQPAVEAAAVEQPAPKFQIAENVEIKKGDSIWSVAEKFLKNNEEFQKLGGGDSKIAEALKTYNIDRVKDVILANPEKYGLSAGIDTSDTTKLTVEDLKNIKWSDAFKDAIQEKGGLLANLPQEQVEGIVQNNAALKEFFQQYPDAPRTVENYENILKGSGDAGIEQKEPSGPQVQEEKPPEPSTMTQIQEEAGTIKGTAPKTLEPAESAEPWVQEERQAPSETKFEDISKWLENYLKIDVEKSSWLDKNWVKNHTVAEVLDIKFIWFGEPVDSPKLESFKWWELEERARLQSLIEKIVKESLLEIDERGGLSLEDKISLKEEFMKKINKMSVGDFLKNRINFEKTLSK
jgi:hypothetical protein